MTNNPFDVIFRFRVKLVNGWLTPWVGCQTASKFGSDLPL